MPQRRDTPRKQHGEVDGDAAEAPRHGQGPARQDSPSSWRPGLTPSAPTRVGGSTGSVSTSTGCSSAAASSPKEGSNEEAADAASSSSSASGDAVVVTVADAPARAPAGGGADSLSVYDLYSQRRVYTITLLVALAAVTVPLANTMYLPAMKSIQVELRTSTAAVTSSVATFQVAIGVGSLLLGPASDVWGRKPVLLLATGLFALLNVPMLLAPNVAVLLAFRTLQGAALAAYTSAGPGLCADICSPAQRGTLFGLCSVAALIGPVAGPPLGGGLTQAFGWRSMFAFLAVLAGAFILPLVVWGVPETLQYKVMARLRRTRPEVAARVKEAQEIEGQGPPVFRSPWHPIASLADPRLALHVAVALLGFATYLTAMAELPLFLARPPYDLPPGVIGLVYLPAALGAVVASPCGGRLSDLAARCDPRQPLRRLLYTCLLQLLVLPPAVLCVGWGLQRGAHLAVPVLGAVLLAAANAAYMPSLFTVVTLVKQQAAAAAAGGVYALTFLMSGGLMMLGAAVVGLVGLGPFLTALAALHAGVALAAFVQIVRHCSDQQLPQRLMSRQGSAMFARSAAALLAHGLSAGKDAQQQAAPGGAREARAPPGCSRDCGAGASKAASGGGCAAPAASAAAPAPAAAAAGAAEEV